MKRVMRTALGIALGMLVFGSAEAKDQPKPKVKYEYLRVFDGEFMAKAPAQGFYVKGYWTGKKPARRFHPVSYKLSGSGPLCTTAENEYLVVWNGSFKDVNPADPAIIPPPKPYVFGCKVDGKFRPTETKITH